MALVRWWPVQKWAESHVTHPDCSAEIQTVEVGL